MRAREQLERARVKAQKIIETVTAHSQAVLRDAEDRTRQLRWQQHQLTSFMAEVKELIRPETPLDALEVDAVDDAAPADGEHEDSRRRPKTAAQDDSAEEPEEAAEVEHVGAAREALRRGGRRGRRAERRLDRARLGRERAEARRRSRP